MEAKKIDHIAKTFRNSNMQQIILENNFSMAIVSGYFESGIEGGNRIPNADIPSKRHDNSWINERKSLQHIIRQYSFYVPIKISSHLAQLLILRR